MLSCRRACNDMPREPDHWNIDGVKTAGMASVVLLLKLTLWRLSNISSSEEVLNELCRVVSVVEPYVFILSQFAE